MLFDRILVGLDGSEGADRAGTLALHLARLLDAHLTAAFVADIRVVEGPAIETLAPLWGEVSNQPFQPEVLRVYRERGTETLERFARRAEELGCKPPDTVNEVGVAEEVLLELAPRADLVVVGRRGEHAGMIDRSIGSTAGHLLHRSPHPVLLAGERTDVPETALVAYDGSEPAVHGLDLAIRYARAVGGALRVVHAGGEDGDAVLDTACSVLEDHSVSWEAVRIDAEIDDAILRARERWAVECLFMGAFGKGWLRDLVFGSNTKSILRSVELPIFVTR